MINGSAEGGGGGGIVQLQHFIRIFIYHNINQSAEGAGGLGIIRGNKVGESEDSNVEFAL